MNILEKIATKKQESLKLLKESLSLAQLEEIIEKNEIKHNDFMEAFRSNDLNIISEIKFASPSEGSISNLPLLEVADDYLSNGAKALSILTEEHYFKGNIDYIKQVKAFFPSARVLMKDFMIDPYQFFQAKAFGADAVLLIVALLGKEKTELYLKQARDLNLTPLVEVHNKEEMLIALDSGAELIGVNNRNLKDLSISLKTSEELASLAQKNTVLISESGIKTYSDLIHLKVFGYKGFLIGTSLMKTGNPAKALAEILGRSNSYFE